jgi:hypothetical protein
MSYPKWPSDLALRRSNQRILAERLAWPDGAVQACQELEDRHPGWYVTWLRENVTPGWERPAGFCATNDDARHEVEVFRESAPEVEEALALGPPEHDYSLRGCAWCLDHLDRRRVRI